MAPNTNLAQPQNPPPKDLAIQELPRPKYQLFTDCPQDWFILVVRGGDLHKIIHSVKGWYVDEEFEFREEDDKNKNIVTLLRAQTGFEFVGIPGIQGMKVTKFAWNKYWREDNNSTTYTVTAHEPELVYITPFESQYPLKFEGIDTIAQNQTVDEEESFVDVTFVVTARVRMLRPRVALMTNNDWFGSILIPKMQSALKDFAGNKNYDQLIRGARETVTKELTTYIMGENESPSPFRQNLLKHAGVDIIDFSLVDIKPNAAFEAAQNALAAEQKKAKGIIVTAEAKKRERELQGQGEEAYETSVGKGKAAGIEAIRKAAGADSKEYLKWSQIHGSQLTTYMEGGSKGSILIGADGKPIS